MSGYAVAKLDEVEPLVEPGAGEALWRPVRHHFGIQAFGVNAWTGRRAGDEVIEKHDELTDDGVAGHEELYVVLNGGARFTVDGDTFDAPEGTVVSVNEPGLVRTAVAVEDGTTVLSVGAARGAVFSVSPWELKYVDGAA